MKMILLAYNAIIDDEVMETFSSLEIKSYTKFPHALGTGRLGGPRLDDEIWPGSNSLLLIALDGDDAARLMSRVREMRKTLGAEGIKAFSLAMEEMT